MEEFVVLQSPPLGNEELNALFESAWAPHRTRDFQPVLARSLRYVAWDGGAHGFILDTTAGLLRLRAE